MRSLPGTLRQQCRTGVQVVERGGVGRRCPRARAGEKVELGQQLQLLRRSNEDGAAIELIDDLVNGIPAPIGWRVRDEPPADLKMQVPARFLRDQRVGSLLNPVVGEPVGTFRALDEPPDARLPRDPHPTPLPIFRKRCRGWRSPRHCRGKRAAAASVGLRSAGGLAFAPSGPRHCRCNPWQACVLDPRTIARNHGRGRAAPRRPMSSGIE